MSWRQGNVVWATPPLTPEQKRENLRVYGYTNRAWATNLSRTMKIHGDRECARRRRQIAAVQLKLA